MPKKNTVVCRVPGDYYAPDFEGTDFSNSPSLTDPSSTPDCDINNILKRYVQTGVLPSTDRTIYEGDFTAVPVYEEALNIVRHADEQFFGLDAHVRKEFDNSPAKFLAYCQDPANGVRLANLGLLSPEGKAKVLEAAAAAQRAKDAPKSTDKAGS